MRTALEIADLIERSQFSVPLSTDELNFVANVLRRRLTDDEIIGAAANAADALDATRVSEIKDGKWHATPIFDGDAGLLRFGRLVEQKTRDGDGGSR